MKKCRFLLTLFLSFSSLAFGQTPAKAHSIIKNIVLVHGAFTDGSSYQKVIHLLQQKGYQVTAVQNPLTSLEDDVSAVKQVLDRQTQDVVLVRHSWAAGNHPKVKKLVYLSAIVPDSKENAAQALARHHASTEGLSPDENGMIWLPDANTYQNVMVHDLPLDEVNLLFATQPPIKASAFSERIGQAAWATKPSYYLLTEQDNALPLKAQQSFAAMLNAKTKQIATSHFSLRAQPHAVAEWIEQAAAE